MKTSPRNFLFSRVGVSATAAWLTAAAWAGATEMDEAARLLMQPTEISSLSIAPSTSSSPSYSPAADGSAIALSLANYPRAGWQAMLSTNAHGTRGTVTIVDADTFRVDGFYYDGGGINVHFILAATDDNNAFRNARLVTDLNLLGMPHNGDSITIDLPAGSTFDGYNAISLWCIPAGANFGSGSFVNTVPEPASAALLALAAIGFGFRRGGASKRK